ncbi:UDP-2,3-diacetamido-2,3-dideoxy-D-glucuronic acid 2-epimerase (EC, partial [Olavius algarvensis Delta 1 endosymbiont]
DARSDDQKKAASSAQLLPKLAKNSLFLGYNSEKISQLNSQISNQTIRIIEPVGYLEMIYLLENCHAVMTDSGGLQKEAFFFQKPCITLRDETEWVELVEHGFNYIAGADSAGIYNAFKNSFDSNKDFDLDLYGDGTAGKKIIEFLIQIGRFEKLSPQ